VFYVGLETECFGGVDAQKERSKQLIQWQATEKHEGWKRKINDGYREFIKRWKEGGPAIALAGTRWLLAAYA
jgi:hypothetical protein